MKTRIYLLLDESGSMHGEESMVRQHVNEYLAQYKDKPDVYVSIISFASGRFTLLRQEEAIVYVQGLNDNEYTPDGGTPLNDAVGRVIDMASNVDFKDDHKLVIVISDGDENDSKRYPHRGNSDLKLRIERLDTKVWGFVYLGERQRAEVAKGVADAFGFAAGNSRSTPDYASAGMMMMAATSNYFANAEAGLVQDGLLDEVEDEQPEEDLKLRLQKKWGTRIGTVTQK